MSLIQHTIKLVIKILENKEVRGREKEEVAYAPSSFLFLRLNHFFNAFTIAENFGGVP